MAVSTKHTLGAIVVGGTSTFNIDGIRSSDQDPQLETILEEAAGQVNPTFVATMRVRPMISAVITDIATALDDLGLQGFQFPQTTVYTTVDFYYTAFAQGSTRQSGSNHRRIRMNEGIIVPRSITASLDQAATLNLDIFTTYDGTNAPFIYAGSVALPHTPSIDEMFTLGAVSINGTTLDGVQSVTIDFGLQEDIEASDGEYYPTFSAILTARPTITIETVEIPAQSTFGLTGTAQTASDSIVYLWRVSENGLRSTSADSISFTIDDGLVTLGRTSGTNNQAARQSVLITPTYDGTNATLVYASNATHP